MPMVFQRLLDSALREHQEHAWHRIPDPVVDKGVEPSRSMSWTRPFDQDKDQPRRYKANVLARRTMQKPRTSHL